jgi:hypothetical protein
VTRRSFTRPDGTFRALDEILPGIYHWSAFHERIGQKVHSYYVATAAALIDPMRPEGGLEAFAPERPPERILLTNRHHYRHSSDFVEAFGCPVLCHEAGLHEFEGGPPVQGFSFGDKVARGIIALAVAAICPEETALLLNSADGVLAVADGVIRTHDGSLSFVPDSLLGDDPEAVKRALRESYGLLLEHDFETLLFAHGEPLVWGGKAALREFVQSR